MAKPQDFLQHAVPGDMLLLNFGGMGNRHVFVRGVGIAQPLDYSEGLISAGTSGLQLQEVFRAESQRQIFLPRALGIESLDQGWVGFRIVKLPDLFVKKYADGWIGREADFWVSKDQVPATIMLSGHSSLPPALAYPIHMTVWEGSRQLADFTIQGPGGFELRFHLEGASDKMGQGYVQLKLVIDKTFIPARYGLGPDTRELSIVIDSAQIVEK